MLRLPRIPGKMRYAIVVAVIFAGCAGLILPSISKVREAAGRSTCTGRIYGLSIALHQYADANGDRIPSGTVPNPTIPVERRLSWYVTILPYMEHDKAFKLMDLKAAADDPKNRLPTSIRIGNLTCPASGEFNTREGGKADPTTGEVVYASGAWKSPGPITHYIGVSGLGTDAASLDRNDPKSGAFGYELSASLAHRITDGRQNTLLLIESGLNPGHWAYGGPSTVRGIDLDSQPYVGEGRPFGGFHGTRSSWFATRDPVGLVTMCDASVRYFSDRVSPEVLAALATANGHENIPADW